MPFINAKISAPVAPEQKSNIVRAISNAMMTVMKKPLSNIMVGIESEYDLWLGGEKVERGAFVSVVHKGAGSIVKYNSLTEKITEALKDELGLDPSAVYITYQMINEWGKNGKIA